MTMTRCLYKRVLVVLLLMSSVASAHAQFWSNKQPELLPEAEAFSVIANIQNGQVKINWSIADDYYMYRESLKIEALTEGLSIGEITFPQGVVEDDPEFGAVEVYFYNIELVADYSNSQSANQTFDLLILGQGCNKPVGVCYPPMQRTVSVTGSDNDSNISNAATSNTNALAAVNQTSTSPLNQNSQKSFFAYVLAAFGAGILLSFTPCVLPMIPILAGVIAGQQIPSKLRSGWLALCYVAGTVVTYIIAGALAGATGSQLQAYFQNIWIIGFICILLSLLAASLFGWFKIQLPSSLQSKLNSAQTNNKSASISSFSLGLISALVVGACVSPVLILALGAAISQGDPVLGASIMAAMATGMGLLLIAFGFGAGWILPKAGAWMNQVQVLFGLMVMGVAVYLLDTLGVFPALYLWAGLLLITGFYLWHLSSEVTSALLQSFWRAGAITTIFWGMLSLLGANLNGSSVLKPLENLSFNSASHTNEASVEFVHTTTLQEVQGLLSQAKQSEKAVLIDFYADWCLDCKRMQSTTYKQSSVIDALSDWSVIEIDVTDTSDASEEVKRYFSVFGPPATLFIGADGNEHQDLRQYGYLNETKFLNLLDQTKTNL